MKKLIAKTLLAISLSIANAYAEDWSVLSANLKITNQAYDIKKCEYCLPYDKNEVLKEKNASIQSLIKAKGLITIVEYENETMATRTISIPVEVRMLSKGLTLQFAESNGKMALRFLSGSKLSDIFGKYYGAELDVAIIGRAGLKTFVNKKGIVVTDFIASGGFGAKLAGTTFGIFAENRQDIKIETKTDTGEKLEQRELTLGELNDHQFN